MRVWEALLVLGQRIEHGFHAQLGISAGTHQGLNEHVEGQSSCVSLRLRNILGFRNHVDLRTSDGDCERLSRVAKIVSVHPSRLIIFAG